VEVASRQILHDSELKRVVKGKEVLSWMAELGDEQLALVFVERELAPAEGYTGDDVTGGLAH